MKRIVRYAALKSSYLTLLLSKLEMLNITTNYTLHGLSIKNFLNAETHIYHIGWNLIKLTIGTNNK